MTFGELVKEQRILLKFSLKDFCVKNNINPEVLDRIEQDKQLPKKVEMRDFISTLKIFEGSIEHVELMRAYNKATLSSSLFDNSLFLKRMEYPFSVESFKE